MANHYPSLNPEKALIWRIAHRDNLPWVLDNGLHCGNSVVQALSWASIGNPELTDRRATHPVPLPLGGLLNDYVPFYFTPLSPMLRNIQAGWLLVNESVESKVSAIREGLRHWRGGEGAASRKARLFNDRALAIALDRLTQPSPAIATV